MKKLIAILLISIAMPAFAVHGYGHLWQKQTQTRSIDQWGNPVIICHWICRADIRNPHYATTSGAYSCPMPM